MCGKKGLAEEGPLPAASLPAHFPTPLECCLLLSTSDQLFRRGPGCRSGFAFQFGPLAFPSSLAPLSAFPSIPPIPLEGSKSPCSPSTSQLRLHLRLLLPLPHAVAVPVQLLKHAPPLPPPPSPSPAAPCRTFPILRMHPSVCTCPPLATARPLQPEVPWPRPGCCRGWAPMTHAGGFQRRLGHFETPAVRLPDHRQPRVPPHLDGRGSAGPIPRAPHPPPRGGRTNRCCGRVHAGAGPAHTQLSPAADHGGRSSVCGRGAVREVG